MGINQIESTLTGDSTSTHPHKKKRKHYHHRGDKRTKPPPSTLQPVDKPLISKQRSLDPILYTQFLDQKNLVNTQVKAFYQRDLFRKLGFRRYVRTKQSAANLIHTIKHTYLTDQEISDGKKLVIFHGDYSRTSQMKGCVPTPNIGLKKLLAKHFELIDVDEYLTSQKYWKTHEQMINLRVRHGHHTRSIHGILIPKENTARCIHVDRDVNASHNMLSIAQYYLAHQERPLAFRRPEHTISTNA